MAPPRTCIEWCCMTDTITSRPLERDDVEPVLDLLRAALGETRHPKPYPIALAMFDVCERVAASTSFSLRMRRPA